MQKARKKKKSGTLSHCKYSFAVFLCSNYKMVTLKNKLVPKQIKHSKKTVGTQQIKVYIFV